MKFKNFKWLLVIALLSQGILVHGSSRDSEGSVDPCVGESLVSGASRDPKDSVDLCRALGSPDFPECNPDGKPLHPDAYSGGVRLRNIPSSSGGTATPPYNDKTSFLPSSGGSALTLSPPLSARVSPRGPTGLDGLAVGAPASSGALTYTLDSSGLTPHVASDDHSGRVKLGYTPSSRGGTATPPYNGVEDDSGATGEKEGEDVAVPAMTPSSSTPGERPVDKGQDDSGATGEKEGEVVAVPAMAPSSSTPGGKPAPLREYTGTPVSGPLSPGTCELLEEAASKLRSLTTGDSKFRYASYLVDISSALQPLQPFINASTSQGGDG